MILYVSYHLHPSLLPTTLSPTSYTKITKSVFEKKIVCRSHVVVVEQSCLTPAFITYFNKWRLSLVFIVRYAICLGKKNSQFAIFFNFACHVFKGSQNIVFYFFVLFHLHVIFSLLLKISKGNGGEKVWNVYLSGEIHSDWREKIASGIKMKNLPVTLTSPNTSHEDSDDCGAIILGMEEQRKNWDKIGATMNGIRTSTLLRQADVVVVRFGEKYRQWNAAFDAGYAAALGKPIITLHPPEISHMLKEVNASANVVCEVPEQVVDTLAYVIRGELPQTPKDGDKFVPIADRLGKGNPNP